MSYHVDGKALLQPVPAPASFCLCQTNLRVRKNSAWRVTNRPRGTRCHHRGRGDMATQLFTSRKKPRGQKERLQE